MRRRGRLHIHIGRPYGFSLCGLNIAAEREKRGLTGLCSKRTNHDRPMNEENQRRLCGNCTRTKIWYREAKEVVLSP